MDITAKNVLRICKSCAAIVSENHLALASARCDKLTVKLDIINTRKGMLANTEMLAVFSLGQNVSPRIDACGVKIVKADKVVSNLVGGVAEHKSHLFESRCNTLEADREAVAGEYGENYGCFTRGEFSTNISGDLPDGRVITL